MSADGVVPATEVQFNFGLAANQGRTLVVSNSGADTTQEYFVSTVINGQTVGSNGVSETFDANNLSVINSVGMTGPGSINLGSQTPGVFMARFGPNVSTTMTMSAANTTLTSMDEMMLRLANPEYPLSDGATGTANIVTAPHLYYNGKLYAPRVDTADHVQIHPENLTVDATAHSLMDMQYIFFVPSSKIGINNSYFVQGGTVQGTPAGTFDYNNLGVYDPTGLTDSEWMTKSPGLSAAIDYFVANGAPMTRDAMIAYFRTFFAKFMGTTMFGSLHTLGNTSNPSPFEIIAMDSTPLSGSSVLNLTYDADNSSFNYDPNTDSMNITGVSSGAPPIKFTTTVTTAP
jgi:hypothetical protein